MDPPITPREADARILRSLREPPVEDLPLAAAAGRTLAAPILADRDLPPYSRAMMDGIAFASASLPPDAAFERAGLHAAGDPPPPPLAPGHAWEIMTGACLPADCDTVVPYEHLSADGNSVLEPFEPGQCIHPAGSDARAGDTLVPAGTRIGPAEVAIAASVGQSRLGVLARPRIVIVSSGDEAVPVDTDPEPWQIRRSNGPMLDALLRQLGRPPAAAHHVPDEANEARRVLHDALDAADLLIVCGGISRGKRDLVRPLLEERLGAPAFHGVRQRPGKPLAFWAGPPLVFALPGNPVSVLATFTRYVLPTLERLDGREPGSASLPLPAGIEPLPNLTWLLPLDAAGSPRPPRNSGDFVSIAGTAAFLEIPPAPEFPAGPTPRFPLFPFC